MSTKAVLFVARAFPPGAGPGAIRNLKFVKNLSEHHRVRVFVLTTETVIAAKHRYDEAVLADLAKESTVVHRVRSYPLRFVFWLRRTFPLFGAFLARFLLVVDEYILWIPAAVLAGWRVGRRHEVDVIYTSSSPNSLTLIGFLLKRLLKKPWVADFRDPWTQNHLYAPPTRLHDAMEQWLEAKMIGDADRIVANTTGNRRRLLEKYLRLSPAKVVVIPNGYDPEDFPAPAQQNGPETTRAASDGGDSLTIAYIGSFYDHGLPTSTKARLVARARRLLIREDHVDPNNTSSPRPLLEALRWLLDNRAPDRLVGKLRIVFVGTFPPGYDSMVTALGLSEVVVIAGQRPHKEAVDQMLRADALLLVLPQSDEAKTWVPAKTYEYLYARKPILALVPEGEARDLILDAGLGLAVAPDDIPAIGKALESLLAKEFQIRPNDQVIARFNRHSLTARLKALFDDVVAEQLMQPFPPASD